MTRLLQPAAQTPARERSLHHPIPKRGNAAQKCRFGTYLKCLGKPSWLSVEISFGYDHANCLALLPRLGKDPRQHLDVLPFDKSSGSFRVQASFHHLRQMKLAVEYRCEKVYIIPRIPSISPSSTIRIEHIRPQSPHVHTPTNPRKTSCTTHATSSSSSPPAPPSSPSPKPPP